MTAKTFELTFQSMDIEPTETCDCICFNQCDGYHQVEARVHDGEFVGFYDFIGTRPYSEGFFAAWAKLPDCVKDLYPVFADPRPFGERT
ncbi:hypothetical protein ACEN9J_03000 [Variovorax sp. Varisp41]|uniref:hypothetical protein n=1 Tax=Variovorax sp. Varisp41 TaxID=3243033 RepID=UPI0039B6D2DA